MNTPTRHSSAPYICMVKPGVAPYICIVLALALAGCSVNDLTVPLLALSQATVAAEFGVPRLEAAGKIDTATGDKILAYAAAVSLAASKSSAELASSDPPATKSLKIAANFAGIAVPAFGPGTGGEVVALVTAIAAAVALFLEAVGKPPAQVKVSASERKALATIEATHADNARIASELLESRPAKAGPPRIEIRPR